MSESWLAPQTPDLVWFRGPDTIRFLNDLISQEITKLAPGQVSRSLLLGPQGKLDHILWVLRGDDEVGLVTDPGRGDELATTLGRYRIRVDVEIVPEDRPVWLVMGEHDATSGQWEASEDGVIADLSWPEAKRTLVVGKRPDLEVGSLPDYEKTRITAGEPRWGADVDEKTIPHESGLVPETVDFTKGCFLGQELVARIDSRGGNVPRHLRRLELEDGSVEPGAGVTLDGDEVGTVTSVSDRLAMASLKRGVDPGAQVTVGDTRARVVA